MISESFLGGSSLIQILVDDIKKKPTSENVRKYCEALEEAGLEKEKISQKVKQDIDNYDHSTLNHFIASEYKDKAKSRNSKIGVMKRGIKILANDMTEPVKEISEHIN